MGPFHLDQMLGTPLLSADLLVFLVYYEPVEPFYSAYNSWNVIFGLENCFFSLISHLSFPATLMKHFCMSVLFSLLLPLLAPLDMLLFCVL